VRLIAALLLLFGFTSDVLAKETATPFDQRALQLPSVLTGKLSAGAFFSPTFLNEIPSTQIKQIADQLSGLHGQVNGIEGIRKESNFNGEVDIAYERATVTMQLVTAKEAPNLVIGLLVTAVKGRGDSLSKLSTEFSNLPGKSAFLIARHGRGGNPEPVAAVNTNDSLAVGSTFKLWVLAEAVAQVKSGKRSWSDVIPLGQPSLPSGITQDWPTGVPMTLHSLASLMISISDNSATDTLMAALGRNAIDNRVAAISPANAPRTLPVLTTLEAFMLKTPRFSGERRAWETGSMKSRRALLNSLRPSVAQIDRAAFGDRPAFIETIEWFSASIDIASTFEALRQSNNKEAMAILAINRPLPASEIRRFAYVGYKGGSEAGVMSMSYLLQSKTGEWYTVTGTWNNPAAAVDERKFESMMQRAVALVR
jgi:hypothetical protein